MSSQRTYRSYGNRQSPGGWFTPGTRGKASRYGYATQPVTYSCTSQSTSSQVVETEIIRQTAQQLEGIPLSQQTQAAQQATQQTQAAQQAAQQVQATQQTTQQSQATQQTAQQTQQAAQQTTPQSQQTQSGTPAAVVELKALGTDLHLTENRREHNTDKYDNVCLIVRRGGHFKLSLDVNRKYNKEQGDKIQLQLAVGPNPRKSKNTLVEVNESATESKNKFSYKVVENKDNKVTISVYIPVDAVVGDYQAAVVVTYKDADKAEKTKVIKLADPIIILFNPFCKDDQVYMADAKERQEYVMNDTGRVYVGTRRQISGRPWNFGQFERSALDAALYLLDESYLATEAHGNVTRVCRALSAMVNSNDDDGVLEGRWSGGYAGGKSPTTWNGSVAILDQFMTTKKPVKYGQCWVFSGVLTTVCRALGIPARSVTNFQSAHDSDCSLTIDQHRDEEGRPLSEYDESIWNFHVWNEGYFKRPDLPEGNNGWQAFDATPQETSEGMFRCGPAPVAAIKEGNVYCGYDAPFIYAEVNGEYVVWKVDSENTITPVSHMERGVGFHISTKAVGKAERMDITDNYKHPEGSKEERLATEKAWGYSSRRAGLQDLLKDLTGHDCSFELDGQVRKNGDILVQLKIQNDSSSSRNIKVRMFANAKYYTGIAGEEIDDFSKEISVAGKKCSSVEWELKIVDYINKLDEDAALGIFASAEVVETKQCFSDQDTFNIDKPDLELKLVDSSKKPISKLEAKKGAPCYVEISFTNPLAIKLTSLRLTVEGAGLQQELTIPTKKVLAPGESIKEYVTITPRVTGTREVIANLHTRQVNGIPGVLEINVTE